VLCTRARVRLGGRTGVGEEGGATRDEDDGSTIQLFNLKLIVSWRRTVDG